MRSGWNHPTPERRELKPQRQRKIVKRHVMPRSRPGRAAAAVWLVWQHHLVMHPQSCCGRVALWPRFKSLAKIYARKSPGAVPGRGSSLPETRRSVAGRYRRPVTAEAVVEAQVTISTSWLIRLLRKAALIGLTTENELLASPMNRWSYSTPNDQFGVKPYSNPTPTVPPQRVELAAANSKPVSGVEDAKAVARHRRAALYVKQRCIPGVADLAGKEADAIGLGASGEGRDRSG